VVVEAEVRLENINEYINPDLKKELDELNVLSSNKDPEDKDVKMKAIEIYEKFGENIAASFFVGYYQVGISSKDSFELKGNNDVSFKMSQQSSSGFKIFGLGHSSSSNLDFSTEDKRGVVIVKKNENNSDIVYGNEKNLIAFTKDIIKSDFGSSFIPISSLAERNAERALKYWFLRWNAKPSTVREYMELKSKKELKSGEQIELYWNEKPYIAEVSSSLHIQMIGGKFLYTYHRDYKHEDQEIDKTYELPIFLDPVKKTISIPPEEVYSRCWKVKTGYRSRAFGWEKKELKIILNGLWRFRDPITIAHFGGDTSLLRVIQESPQVVSLHMEYYEGMGGQSWDTENRRISLHDVPLYVELQ
jgi:hypothetical protein